MLDCSDVVVPYLLMLIFVALCSFGLGVLHERAIAYRRAKVKEPKAP